MGRKKLEENSENITESKKKVTSKKAVDKSTKEKTTTKKVAAKGSEVKVATKRSASKSKKDEPSTKKSVEKKTRSKALKEKIEKNTLNEAVKDNDKKEILTKNDTSNKDLEDTKVLVVDSKIYKVRIADIVAVIVSILLILFLLYEVVLYEKVNKSDDNENVNNSEKVEASLNKEFRLTTEESIDIKKFFQNGDLLSDSLEVIIINSEGKKVNLEKRYYDIDGTEVNSSVALNNGKLNGGFYTRFYIGEVGTFDVTVKDLDNKKEYKTKFIVEDKTKPVLVLKDVIINVGEEVSVDDFVLSIFDNSKKDCKVEFVLNAGETLDLSEGEHKIKIKATDVYGNKTVLEARLIVVS